MFHMQMLESVEKGERASQTVGERESGPIVEMATSAHRKRNERTQGSVKALKGIFSFERDYE